MSETQEMTVVKLDKFIDALTTIQKQLGNLELLVGMPTNDGRLVYDLPDFICQEGIMIITGMAVVDDLIKRQEEETKTQEDKTLDAQKDAEEMCPKLVDEFGNALS